MIDTERLLRQQRRAVAAAVNLPQDIHVAVRDAFLVPNGDYRSFREFDLTDDGEEHAWKSRIGIAAGYVVTATKRRRGMNAVPVGQLTESLASGAELHVCMDALVDCLHSMLEAEGRRVRGMPARQQFSR